MARDVYKRQVYVWIDALTNYITGLGYDCDGNHGEKFKHYWPADVHLIGKDILRFHTIYWPIMLMALDLPLPKQVFGHPWLLVGEGKMSKSKGNVIYADDLVRYFGVDAVRYIMLHEMPFAQDLSLIHIWLIFGSAVLGMIVLVGGQLVVEHGFSYSIPISVLITIGGGLYFLILLFGKGRQRIC